MRIESYIPEHFDQVANLIKEHNSIARRTLDTSFSFTDLESKLLEDGAVTFCCFIEDELVSFLVSHRFESMPTWYVRLVCTKKTTFFNPVRIGICELYNSTITHWESRGITNFVYVQPSIFLRAGNAMTRKGSIKLQQYTPHNYYTINANTRSDQLLIRKLVGDNIFEEDMTVRWCFKNEE